MAKLKPHQSLLLGAAAVSAILWLTPALRVFILPLAYLNTHVHELCHALAAWFTGGSVDEIRVFRDGSGVTLVRGGIASVTASAGYFGASAFGAAILLLSAQEKSARAALAGLAGLIGISILLLVRGDAVGLASGLLWAAALGLLAFALKGELAVFVGQFLGIQMTLTSLSSFSDLLRVSVSGQRSDAAIMQDLTFIPAPIWAVIWALFSVALVAISIRRAWESHSTKAAP